MADIEWCSIAPWLRDHVLYDARVSLEYRRILVLTGAYLSKRGWQHTDFNGRVQFEVRRSTGSRRGLAGLVG